jgi:hypothetical protein
LHGIDGNFCAGYDLKELIENMDRIGTFLLLSEGVMLAIARFFPQYY